MEIFSQIISALENVWDQVMPFLIVKEYEHGVLLRFGKFHKEVSPGLILKWPVIDYVATCYSSYTTLPIRAQTLTTKDDKSIVISAVVKYRIRNAKTFLLEVNDATDAINDITQSYIKQTVMNKTWEELKQMQDSEIQIQVESEVKKFGIKVYYVTVTDLAIVKTLRLMQ